jgi:hypothetical protein
MKKVWLKYQVMEKQVVDLSTAHGLASYLELTDVKHLKIRHLAFIELGNSASAMVVDLNDNEILAVIDNTYESISEYCEDLLDLSFLTPSDVQEIEIEHLQMKP